MASQNHRSKRNIYQKIVYAGHRRSAAVDRMICGKPNAKVWVMRWENLARRLSRQVVKAGWPKWW